MALWSIHQCSGCGRLCARRTSRTDKTSSDIIHLRHRGNCNCAHLNGLAARLLALADALDSRFFPERHIRNALGLISEYSKDSASAARLSAMTFFITYTVAAAGPLIAGVLLDYFDSWSMVFTILAGVSVLQLLTVLPLRRNVHVD